MKKIIYSAILAVMCSCSTTNDENKIVESIGIENKQVNYYLNDLEKPFKAMFLADLHYTVEDQRGAEFYDFSKRMGGWAVEPENYGKSNGRELGLIASLEKAKKEGVELIILGGDILNFPSEASVEGLMQIMNDSGIEWLYTAGNHDWHYEGESGASSDLRAKWQAKSLKPLYQGENPLYASVILKGVNFVVIDNSTYEVVEEQVQFLEEQVTKGLPIVLSMHIPLHLAEHTDNIDYGVGHPDWGESRDTYYEIERRERWPKEGHTQTTFDFRDLVLGSDNIIGVFAGHTHKKIVDIHDNIFQYVVGSNFNGDDVIINFVNARK